MTKCEKPLTRSAQKRLDILVAAVELFSEDGFQSTSMDMISAQAQVSKRTVYNHFSSKEVLFKEILKDLISRIRVATEIPYQSNLSLKSQLQMIALNEVELLKDECMMQLSRVCIAESIHSPELVKSELDELNSSNFGFGVWVKAAIRDKKLVEEEPMLMVHHFIGAIKEMFFWPRIFTNEALPNEERIREMIERTINMFLREYQLKE